MSQQSKQTIGSNNFLVKNKWFFIPFLLLWLPSLVFAIFIPKGEEVFWLNAHRTPFWDFFFMYSTKLGEYGSYILIFLLLLRIRFRYAVVFPLLIVLVGSISFCAKKFFDQPRPYYHFRIEKTHERIVHFDGLTFRQGTMSFPSGHTFSAFAMAAFLAFVLKRKKTFWAVSLAILAFIVGFSRVYLVQHFAKDVVFGAILGVIVATACYLWATTWDAAKYPWLDQSNQWFRKQKNQPKV